MPVNHENGRGSQMFQSTGGIDAAQARALSALIAQLDPEHYDPELAVQKISDALQKNGRNGSIPTSAEILGRVQEIVSQR